MTLLSDIKTRNDFFEALGIEKQTMTYLLYKKGTDNMYTSFEIAKKNGGSRKINAPNSDLKYVQKQLYKLLWEHQVNIWKNKDKFYEYNLYQKQLNKEDRYRVPTISHAFEENKSIITNAQKHRNKKIVLNVDLKDFFDAFHFGRVRGFFEKDNDFKVPSEVATIIAQIACYKSTLPQGAPSSPIITNLICRIMDYRILKLSKKNKLSYTRYADDLTFSTNDLNFVEKSGEFLSILTEEIQRAGFQINDNKTRIQYKDSQQVVTGLIVNKKINVSRKYYKETRAMANNLYKTGTFLIDGKPGTIDQLNGRFSFINQLDKFNNRLDNEISLNKNKIEYQKNLLTSERLGSKYIHWSRKFNGREQEYQKFLFYKYFFANEKIIIITEGKTDIRYLKGALKKFHLEYPDLVEKVLVRDGITGKEKEEFIYKVSFLNRSKTLRYFFDFDLDGADAMKKLYNFFSNKSPETYINYLKYFNEKTNLRNLNKVLFLYDNEIADKNKPLSGFFNHIMMKPNEKDKLKEQLKEELYCEINSKLSLITNPLVKGMESCEMEDLFSDTLLNKKFDGKKFDRDGGKDTIGKDIFSQYVLTNYKKINFDNFKPILEVLNDLV